MASKASRIDLFTIRTPQMRAFHLTWMAFFTCFFAWFACAPLMPVIKGEFGLTIGQIANINIAAVAITILVRLVVGPMCDRFGPRKTYTWLLALGALVPLTQPRLVHDKQHQLVPAPIRVALRLLRVALRLPAGEAAAVVFQNDRHAHGRRFYCTAHGPLSSNCK